MNKKRGYPGNIAAFYSNTTRLVGLISLFLLAIANAVQYFCQIEPCALCVYQRALYWGIVGLAGVAWLKPHWDQQIRRGQGTLLMGGLVLSLYHVGLEQQWLAAPAQCAVMGLETDSLEALEAAIMRAPLHRCETINWWIAGVSVTLWNAFVQLLLGALVWYARVPSFQIRVGLKSAWQKGDSQKTLNT